MKTQQVALILTFVLAREQHLWARVADLFVFSAREDKVLPPFDYKYRSVRNPDGSIAEGVMTSDEAKNLARGGSVFGLGTHTASEGGGLFGMSGETNSQFFRNGNEVPKKSWF